MGNRINAAVEEIIRKFVKNPKFEEEIRKLIGGSIDTSELDREYDGLNFRYMNGRNVLGVDWDNESTDETMCLLSRKD